MFLWSVPWLHNVSTRPYSFCKIFLSLFFYVLVLETANKADHIICMSLLSYTTLIYVFHKSGRNLFWRTLLALSNLSLYKKYMPNYVWKKCYHKKCAVLGKLSEIGEVFLYFTISSCLQKTFYKGFLYGSLAHMWPREV